MKTKDSFILLMVDDDHDDYYLMKKALSEKGVEGQLRHIPDAAELMNYLSCFGSNNTSDNPAKPGLILLDLNMPGMNGIEALKKIRAMEHMNDIPVIIFTTSSEKVNVQQCYQEGADEYIVKPSDFEGLLHVAGNIKRQWM